MLKKFLIIKIFFLFFFSTYAEEQKIVYVNVDKIMQQSIAGKSIKKQLEKFNLRRIRILTLIELFF